MIIASRGEGVDPKALGSGQRMDTSKGKGKANSRSLAEYLVAFADLLEGVSADGSTRSVKGSLVSVKGSLVKEGLRGGAVNSSPLLGKGRMHLNRSLGSFGRKDGKQSSTPPVGEKVAGEENPESGLGQKIVPKDGSISLGKGRVQNSSHFQLEGKNQESPAGGTRNMELSRGGKNILSPSISTGKDSVANLASREGDGRKIPLGTVAGKKEVGRNPVDVRERSFPKPEPAGKENMLQNTLVEGKPIPAEKAADRDSEFPRAEVRLDLSGESPRTTDQTGRATLSVPGGRETFLQQMQEKGNAQIVQQAQFLLKNQEEGEIRLNLKPERLGEVRIRLHLQDRLIGGHITVENSTVKELFEQNKGDLAQAFQEQGFEMSQLEVSVGNDPRKGEAEQEPILSFQGKVSRMAEQVPSVERGWMDIHRLVDYYA
ncbi:MAG: hypothetical protein Kow009_03650 [Spirochaetales bacterium]